MSNPRKSPHQSTNKENTMSFASGIESYETVAASPESPLREATLRIEGALAGLESLLSTCEKRLSPLLRPSEPIPTSERIRGVDRVAGEHVADLRRHAEYIDDLAHRLGSLLDRVDV